MSEALQRRFNTAVKLATEAGRLAMAMRASASAYMKGPQDWVTQVDGAIEQFLSQQLAMELPKDGFQGEEEGVNRTGLLHWVVDPIDGTANYMRGGSRFCVSLACIEDRQPLIGVIVAPALQETFAACRHQGATLNEQPIRAAGTTDPGHSIIEVGWSLRRSNQDFLSLCKRLFDIGATLRHGGSGALGLADVAAGRMDAYAELHINLWDVAAGLVILAEAGASISDFMHGEGLVAGNPILACTQGLWDTLSALVL